MIAKEQLLDIGRIKKLNKGQAEKDYLIDIMLLSVTSNSRDELVFKGGTSLQKTINMPRYSEDLDFTTGDVNIEELCDRIIEKIKYYGYESQYKKIKPVTGDTIKFRIDGPLYTRESMTATTIRLDISSRENVILKTKMQTINPAYNDLPQYTINTMDECELLRRKSKGTDKKKTS